MTNKLVFGLVAAGSFALAGIVGAQAADLAGVPVVPPEVVSGHDWSGAYIGLSAGYGWGEVDGEWGGEFEGFPLEGPVESFDLSGGLLGGQIGYNAQFDSIVLGIEGSLAFADISGSGTQFDTGGVLVDATVTTNWIATLGGRFGFAVDSLLLYGSAGIAAAGVDLEVVSTGALDATASDSNTHVGGFVGLGAEFAFDDNWSLGLDYKYADLGEEDYEDPETIDGSATVGVTDSLFSVRLNYSF